MIRYSIAAADPHAHLFRVSLSIARPDPQGQVLSLPAWIPGSYMIREFSRNIVCISASAENNSARRKVALKKRDKCSWVAAPVQGALRIDYEVYAWDLSVRGAHLDASHGFFNGSSVFLCAEEGLEDARCEVEILRPEGEAYESWRVATALPRAGAAAHGFGVYAAADYDELIDHPIEMGNFTLGRFTACGMPHEIAITGEVPKLDMARLTADLEKICTAQIKLFEPRSAKAPMQRYVFLTMAVGDGYGGLEHRASTALMCSRADLPILGETGQRDGYRSFLGLCSHEYFHTWNVKRIKPAAFAPYDLARENYTSLLWLFEGFTSYYDDLMLARAGLIGAAEWGGLVAKAIGAVMNGSGRTKQTLAESSFDAWTKYYRQDENAPNAIVSYYTKGSLVALALDLNIRLRSQGCRSLDDLMRLLWREYGRDFYAGKARGVGEDEVGALIERATGLDLRDWLAAAVEGTRDLSLEYLLAEFGFALSAEASSKHPSLGVRTTKLGRACVLSQVWDGGAAQSGGLSAGDELVAIDGLRVTESGLDGLLSRYQPGDAVEVQAFRRDELRSFPIHLGKPEVNKYKLVPVSKPARQIAGRRKAWLGR
ncbi:MAG: M61 family metallopeptidase [Candidatus Protistobacter heckmanni]|nr:M61 family metallopeptidase [Candidatus Protistobacter heckmanni]